MAVHGMVMPGVEISDLMETLSAQQELLQKLNNELDAEREASATAASEALSLIIRLQGEKAGMKMEAEQYKRLAEERICHAEESFAVIEDTIQDRDIEVAVLETQIQTYRSKLLSMGCDDVDDPNEDGLKSPETLLEKKETLLGDNKGVQGMRRIYSAPMIRKCKKAMRDKPSSLLSRDNTPGTAEGLPPKSQKTNLALDSEKKADSSTHEGMDSYSEKIKNLSVQVKRTAGDNYTSSSTRNETRSPLFPSGQSVSDPSTSNGVGAVGESEKKICPASSSKEGEAIDCHDSPSVHDVFEAPQVDESGSMPSRSSTADTKMKKACLDSEIRESKELAHPEAVKLCTKDHDWMTKVFQSSHDEKHLCRPSDIAAIDCATRESTTSVAEQPETSLNQCNRTSVMNAAGERLSEFTSREGELKLLKEINVKIDLLRAEIRSQKEDQTTPVKEEQSFHLPEAMLYFWL